MNRIAILLCGTCFVATAAIAAPRADEVKHLNEAASVVTELRHAASGIPESLWDKAECVVVIPSLKKAAFVVGGETGAGVMSCRRANGWSAPVFMHLTKGSFGLQIGAESVDLVLLVMNQRGADKLLADKVSLGADASIAAGPVGRTTEAATDAQLSAELLSYSRSHGLFAGIDLSGGVLRPDEKADARVYGPKLTAREIVDPGRKVHPPAAAQMFLRSLGPNAQAEARPR